MGPDIGGCVVGVRTLRRGTLAIDPGIQNTGWAFRTPGGFIHSGTIVTDPRDSVFFRIAQGLEELGDKLKRAEIVLIEDFLGRLGRSTVMQIGALGAGAAAAVASRVFCVPNRVWAPEFAREKVKEKIKAATMKRVMEAGAHPKTQHEADALGMLFWWEQKHGRSLDGTPEPTRYRYGAYKRTGALANYRFYREALRRELLNDRIKRQEARGKGK